MKDLHAWLDDYSQSHMNPRNKTLHWCGIPIIVFSVIGLMSVVSLGPLNLALIGLAAAVAYYALLSWRLALGMTAVFAVLYLAALAAGGALGGAMVPTMVGVFVFGWVLQFIGHEIEGAKPSFFKDLQFLLIGPLWLLADVYRRLDLPMGNRTAPG
jgi:uncharacterized membrane protein YGL010W